MIHPLHELACRWHRHRDRVARRRAAHAVIEAAKAVENTRRPYDDTQLAMLRRAVRKLRELEGQR